METVLTRVSESIVFGLKSIKNSTKVVKKRWRICKGDNYHRRLMITSEKLSAMDLDFKRHISRGCRTAINHEFDPDKALMCAIALGNRKFAFEVLPDMIEKYAKEVALC